jgi:hypothetical protein
METTGPARKAITKVGKRPEKDMRPATPQLHGEDHFGYVRRKLRL